MERFLEWAYTGDYPEQTPHETSTTGNTPDDAASTASGSTTTTTAKDKKGGKEKSALKSAPSSHLIIHARLYALADRFNVTGLKGLAFTKLTDILVELDYLTDPRDIKDAIAMIAYAFENLPVASGESGGMGEKLLDYLVQYAAWSLGALRVHEEFWELVEGEADFAKGVLAGVEEAEIAPWKEQGKAKEKRKIKKSNAPKKEDVLKRRCTNGNCGWVGNFLVRCPSCNFLDHKTNQCGEYLEGVQTLTGTGSSLLYKCWRSGCGWSHAFNGMPTLNCASCYGTGYNYNV